MIDSGAHIPCETRHLWWVCFVTVASVRESRWKRRFSSPGFDHCFALGSQRGLDASAFQCVEWTSRRLEVSQIGVKEAAAIMDGVREHDGNIVLWTRDTLSGPGLRLAWGWYCVPLMQHLVGIPGLLVTPLQLARALLRSGGRFEHRGLNSAKALP